MVQILPLTSVSFQLLLDPPLSDLLLTGYRKLRKCLITVLDFEVEASHGPDTPCVIATHGQRDR